ncbi:MAG: hypothetical protein A2Y45_07650 [Tenericutes bacterium GWC2_34_14]|nr:MAG: hypothetical protein A2Z84_02480 [Tenericutes bacterium GWA2_35_7]OHE29774.1 MAG: hypothetical protein A2Y45_07650 [Tenericutes bacterium GWC2_34_14]OHE34753.1 MAG: hypothetical protein A2012_01260 [Tenericutes bacterium GWE2_34_108]OHE37386.1 MAG: hypothetical protein A2Y46_01750 [Tenericutes bacterium GWF1_35_14]OHE39481.1 MAG: hypothetical protein A2Y44_01110 [Tenericutes bacterium GWF2_35_184]OHE42564.1 MAG: hypothetical protein A3K26_04210 [Tenericutes bacterium RIFOXYA12_FULL_35_
MKEILLNVSIYQLIQQYPELQDIIYRLGFTDIVKPGMLQTVGRFMTIKQGSELKKIPLETIKEVLKNHGYSIKED